MVEGLTDAQIITRLKRLEHAVAKLYAESTGAEFTEAQQVVADL